MTEILRVEPAKQVDGRWWESAVILLTPEGLREVRGAACWPEKAVEAAMANGRYVAAQMDAEA